MAVYPILLLNLAFITTTAVVGGWSDIAAGLWAINRHLIIFVAVAAPLLIALTIARSYEADSPGFLVSLCFGVVPALTLLYCAILFLVCNGIFELGWRTTTAAGIWAAVTALGVVWFAWHKKMGRPEVDFVLSTSPREIMHKIPTYVHDLGRHVLLPILTSPRDLWYQKWWQRDGRKRNAANGSIREDEEQLLGETEDE